MTAPSPSNQQRALEVNGCRPDSSGTWCDEHDEDGNPVLGECLGVPAIAAALDEAEARGRAEGLEQGRGDLEAWQRTCRAEGRAEAAAKIEALLRPNGVPLHDSKRITVGELRALAADLTAPADRSQP